jgi:serine/threonine protein kinase
LGTSDFHAADVNLAGRVIGGCRLLHLLGVGGMGAVWQAHHLALDIPVALKLMLPLEELGPSAGERLLREARAAARLRHPNIVGVFNVGEEAGVHFLVMEFVEGKSLQKLLDERGALPVAEALHITAQILDALELTFAHRIVHRDIKPDNILIDSQGVAKLADLGLAKQLGTELQLTQTGMVMGSPYYIAPEQASDTKSAGPLVDIYSLGCVLFHMVAGAPPFSGTTHLEVVLKHIRDPIPDLLQVAPLVPAALGPIVAKMMAKEPKDRFATPSEVRQALQPLLQPGTIGQGQSAGRDWRKLRRLKFVGPGLLVVGLGISLHWCGRDRQAAPKKETPVATPSAAVRENPVATNSARSEAAPAKPQHRPRRVAAEPSAPWVPRESPRARNSGEPPWAPRARGGGLYDALEARDTERLRTLLDRGTPPNVAEGQSSPLHEAVRLGEPGFVRMLLEKGANPNARDYSGETPLHEALRRRDRDMVGALLDFGANPNLPDRMGLTPLQAAGSDGYLVRRLLEKGAH